MARPAETDRSSARVALPILQACFSVVARLLLKDLFPEEGRQLLGKEFGGKAGPLGQPFLPSLCGPEKAAHPDHVDGQACKSGHAPHQRLPRSAPCACMGSPGCRVCSA